MKKSGTNNKSNGDGAIVFLFGAGLLLYIIVRVLMELAKLAMQLIAMAYQGVMTLIDILVSACVVFSGAILIIFALALIIDILRPVFKNISEKFEKTEAVKNCAYPTITAFRGDNRHE